MVDDVTPPVEPAGVDLSTFVPESFKTDDGFDTAKFRESYDDLVTFKSQADESKASLPEGPEGYAFTLPDEFQLPEGFDPKVFETKDDEGNTVEFDPASLIDGDDADIPLLQDMMHKLAQGEMNPVDATKALAGMLVTRELRAVMEAAAGAEDHMKALGPEGKSRISTMQRELASRVPEAQAKAILDDITSADTLRGLEALVKSTAKAQTSPAPGNFNPAEMSIDERLEAGFQQRASRA